MNAPVSTLSHDSAAALLQVTPDQLTKLVGSGIVRRSAPGKFVPAQIIRDYIAHLHSEPDRRDRAPTQAEIASHLDMSDRNVREVLTQLGLDHKEASLAEIRVSYLRRLRETAAGRASGTDGGLDLVQERAALAREQRMRLELINATARGEYAPIATLADVLARASAAIVSMLDQLDGRIAQSAPDLPEATRLAVLNTIAAARNECVRTTASLDLGEPITTDDDTGEATVQILDADA